MTLFKDKLEQYNRTFTLDAEEIDRFAEYLEEVLSAIGVERQNLLRIRFSMDEALLRFRDRLGEEQKVTFSARSEIGRISLTLETEGEAFNPLSAEDEELADWSSSLLTAVGLSPRYSYSGKVNSLRITLPKKQADPLIKFLIAVLGGVFIGILRYLFPAVAANEVFVSLTESIFTLWLRILQLIA